MQVQIDEIKVKHRIRNSLEEIDSLMESMKLYGLLNPITINKKNVLIAGRRRLEAATRLGWRSIQANIIDTENQITELELEIEENTQRSNFTDEELLSAYARLEKLKNPSIFLRIWRAIVDFFKMIISFFIKK